MKITRNLTFDEGVSAPFLKAATLLLPATGTVYKVSRTVGGSLKLNKTEGAAPPLWKNALKVIGCIVFFPLALAAIAIKANFKAYEILD